MPIGTLLAEHRRIMANVESLETLVAGARPDMPDMLFRDRWAFTRDLLLHFSKDETLVLRPLMGDRRPHVAALAKQSAAQLAALYEAFQLHTKRWQGFPAEADWPEYSRAVRHLLARLRARIAAEEAGLYHFLPAQRDGSADRAPPTDYAATAWRIRDGLYPGNQKNG